MRTPCSRTHSMFPPDLIPHESPLTDSTFARWSESRVIKGLLKQCQEFNIAAAWKKIMIMAQAPGRTLHLKCSMENAEILKHKLEFNEGTPQGLAEEVFRVAVNTHSTTTDLRETRSRSWTKTLTSSSMEPGSGRRTWPDALMSGNHQTLPFSTPPDQMDVHMQDATNFI